MPDRERHQLAARMVTSLPRFGYWAKSIRDFETPHGQVGYRQLELLWALRYDLIEDNPVTPSAIAAHFEVRPSVVTRILAKLEAHGLVSRFTDPQDGRSVTIRITDKGTEVSAFVEELYDQEMLATLAALDDAQIAELSRNVEILDRISLQLIANRKRNLDQGA
jgi:DNA-binding MarR family transcriptional regulator